MAKKGKTKFKSMADRARERASERETTGGSGYLNVPKGTSFFQPKKGKYKIDIIPYIVSTDNHPEGVEAGDPWYRRILHVHYGIGAEDKAYLCLKTIGKRCPICDQRAKLMKDANADDEILKALKPKERDLFQVIDLDNEDKGIQLWEFSYHLFGKLLEKEIRESDEDEGLAGFADLEGGKTLHIRFSEKTLGKNKFLEVDRIDFKDRDDYDEDVLENALDLDEIINVLDYDKLEAIYFEQDEEEAPKKSKKKDDDEPKNKKKDKKKQKEEPADDEITADDINEMKFKDLKALVEERELDVDLDDFTKDEIDNLREAIIEALELDPPKKDKKKDKKEEKKKDKKKGADEEGECPVEDGTFGEDCDDHDECLDCNQWKECKAAQKAMKKKK